MREFLRTRKARITPSRWASSLAAGAVFTARAVKKPRCWPKGALTTTPAWNAVISPEPRKKSWTLALQLDDAELQDLVRSEVPPRVESHRWH